MRMDKDTFWRIIDEVNSEVAPTDLDGIVAATKDILCADYSRQEIAVWSNYQRHYCDLADTSGVFAASCCLNDYMSDDGFIDFRMWLISQGKAAYLAALKNPDTLSTLDAPKDTTRFESYGYVAYNAYDALDMHGDVYEEKERNPLTTAQKAEIMTDIEYYPHRVTGENAASHLPNLINNYLEPGAKLSFKYSPGSLCPSPADQMSGLEKLKNAARLIEDMTGSRFASGTGGSFIYPEYTPDAYLAINMRKKGDYAANRYWVEFDVTLQTRGKPMDAAGLLQLQQEAGVAYALLTALEMRQYSLTPEEMQDFNDYVREQETLREAQEESNGPMMGQSL